MTDYYNKKIGGEILPDREILIEERRIILVDILNYIDNVCTNNNLNYFIAYGSLIGVIRHKGFIPWDDDIDVWVPIEDYGKLLNIIENEGKYQVGNNIYDKNWFINFAKVSDKRTILVDDRQSNFTYKGSTQRGVAVDIFPLYEINTLKIAIIEILCKIRRLCYWYEHDFLNGWKRVLLGTLETFGFRTKRISKMLFKIENIKTSSDQLGCSLSPYGKKDSFNKESFSKSIRMPFESIYVRVPVGYHEILKVIYGDYMTPPPEEQRQQLYHNVRAYWVE